MNSCVPHATAWSLADLSPAPATAKPNEKEATATRPKSLPQALLSDIDVEAARIGWLRNTPVETYVVHEVSDRAVHLSARGLKAGQRVELCLWEPAASEPVKRRGRVTFACPTGHGWANVQISLAGPARRA